MNRFDNKVRPLERNKWKFNRRKIFKKKEIKNLFMYSKSSNFKWNKVNNSSCKEIFFSVCFFQILLIYFRFLKYLILKKWKVNEAIATIETICTNPDRISHKTAFHPSFFFCFCLIPFIHSFRQKNVIDLIDLRTIARNICRID